MPFVPFRVGRIPYGQVVIDERERMRRLFDFVNAMVDVDGSFLFVDVTIGRGTNNDPFISLHKIYLGDQEWKLRVGGTSLGSATFDIYNATAGTTAFAIASSNNVLVGTADQPTGNVARLYVYGGANGANVDVRGDGAVADQAVIELEGSDYDSVAPNSLLAYYGGVNAIGTTLGFANTKLGMLKWTGATTALIYTNNTTPLRFGTNDTIWMTLSSTGALVLTGALTVSSLAITSATPFVLTNGQAVSVALTSQTVGPATITIPDFAGASDTFVFTTLAQTLSNKTFIAPVLGVASATSLATSAASPLLLTNGQLVTIALTSQTTGATTLTIPDFASVVDEFVFKTKAVTMSNKTFIAPVLGAASATSLACPTFTTASGDMTVTPVGILVVAKQVKQSSAIAAITVEDTSTTNYRARYEVSNGLGIQWKMGTGLKAGATDPNFSITEYLDGTVVTTRFNIERGGNVSIGNQVAVSLLDLNSITGGVLTLRRFDGTITANDMIGKIQFYAADNQTTSNFIVADIEAQATNTVATDINPGRLIFRTTPVGVAAVPTESFRINETQNVVFATPCRLKGYTVATLPAGTQGDKAFVTDAVAPAYLVAAVGGGAVVAEVFYDGTNWICT